jgi:hypothetical protein
MRKLALFKRTILYVLLTRDSELSISPLFVDLVAIIDSYSHDIVNVVQCPWCGSLTCDRWDLCFVDLISNKNNDDNNINVLENEKASTTPPHPIKFNDAEYRNIMNINRVENEVLIRFQFQKQDSDIKSQLIKDKCIEDVINRLKRLDIDTTSSSLSSYASPPLLPRSDKKNWCDDTTVTAAFMDLIRNSEKIMIANTNKVRAHYNHIDQISEKKDSKYNKNSLNDAIRTGITYHDQFSLTQTLTYCANAFNVSEDLQSFMLCRMSDTFVRDTDEMNSFHPWILAQFHAVLQPIVSDVEAIVGSRTKNILNHIKQLTRCFQKNKWFLEP